MLPLSAGARVPRRRAQFSSAAGADLRGATDVGIRATADLARVDDDDLTLRGVPGVAVRVDLEPDVLKRGVKMCTGTSSRA